MAKLFIPIISAPLFFLLLLVFLLPSSSAHALKRKSKNLNRKPSNTSTHSTQSDNFTLERILKAQDQRNSKDPYVVNALHHPSRRVVQSAILALGRIGDPNSIEALSYFLTRRDAEMKRLVAFSLSLIGGELSYKLLSQSAAMEKDPSTRGALYLAMGRVGNEPALQILHRALQTETMESISGNIAEAIGLLWSGDSAKWNVSDDLLLKLISIAKMKSEAAISAAFALSRFKGDPKLLPLEALIDAIGKSPFPYAQGLLVRTLAKIQSPNLGLTLAAVLAGQGPTGLKIEAAKALRGRPTSLPLFTALKQALLEKNAPILISTLETIGSYGAAAQELTEAVDKLYKNSKSAWVKGTALKVLCRISPDTGRKLVLDVLQVPTSPIFPAAITCLVILRSDADLALYVETLYKGEPRIIGESLDALLSYPAEAFPESIKTGLKILIVKSDMGLTSQIAELANQNKWKEFAPLLGLAYANFNKEDQIEVKISILNALAIIGTAAQVPIAERAMQDSDRLVIVAAVATLKALTGKDESAKIPLNSKVTHPLPSWNAIQTAMNARIVMKTTQGDIELRMLPDAPVTAYHFVHFAQTRFYDGKIFHRVVPNFVTQGGDPRGDGFGGPGFLIRDEVSLRRHDRGTLGIATAGRDTGGCQFFFNLAPNLHLNGKYTAFAEVVKGFEVVDRLEIGDRILTIRVR